MTVHHVTLLTEDPEGVSLQQARNAVEAWLDRHEETLMADRSEVNRWGTDESTDGPIHLRGHFRFTLSSSKSELLETIEDILQQHVGWYVVQYHGCDHDRDPSETEGCSIDAEITWGPVPDGVRV